jgi:hypothetical protein
MILAELGEEFSAVEALHRAVAPAPGFTAAWRGLADLHVALGEAQQAGIAYAAGLRAETTGSELAPAAAALAEDPKRAEALLRARLACDSGKPIARSRRQARNKYASRPRPRRWSIGAISNPGLAR